MNVKARDRLTSGQLIGTIIVAVFTIVGIAFVAANRFLTAFTADGLALEVPIPAEHGAPTSPSGAALQVTQAIVTVPSANAGLAALAVGTILLAAFAGIAVVILYLALALEISRGRPFSRRSNRLLAAISAVVLLGTTGCYLLDSAIARSVRSAAGFGEIGSWTPLSYWMGFAIVGALGLIAYAFRRGSVLQRETEGLV
ncbi:hypothetical protein [Microbacterium sp.]|uniref:hypothetical protein n=1 Tax=Microbacterium sp. TaxID=51671 RepID=UPI002810C81B|nr:hypothetical protein [Microbacterium sp.]